MPGQDSLKPYILSLPDDAILRVFANFASSTTKNVRLGDDQNTAEKLAAAHLRFDRLHRLAVVKCLHASMSHDGKAKEHELLGMVQRQLPRARMNFEWSSQP